MQVVHRASRWLFAVLVVALVACGGGGGGGDSAPPAVVGSKIFVGDSGNGLIGSSANSNPSPGTGLVDRIIQGGNTFLTSGPLAVKDFALDAANDRLYVSDSTRLLAFNSVGTASGNVVPRILATASGGDTFAGIHLDTVNNRLYAIVRLSPTGNEVRVYESASTATSATATRIFTFTCDNMFDIAVDPTPARDVAYVFHVTSGVPHVAVLSGASTLSGAQAVTQSIDYPGGLFPSSASSLGMFIDAANDRLYVPSVIVGNGTVDVYDPAHAANGPAAPLRAITLPLGVISYTNIFVELNGNRLYAADPFGLTILQSASTTTSSVGGVRVIAPVGSTFTAVAVKP